MTTATTTAGLNLRTGPGTQFNGIEVLPPQTVCEVIVEQDEQTLCDVFQRLRLAQA